MGTPDFTIPVAEALLRLGLEVVAVYTKPDKPSGRGLRTEPPPVKEWALSRGLRVVQPESLRKAEAQQEMAALKPDVVVVAAYGRILPGEVLRIPPRGCVNIHPSLLPQYRGTAPVVTALLDGVSETGVTLMLLDEGMDSGPILVQRVEPVLASDTAESLTTRLFQRGAELLEEVLPRWLQGGLSSRAQNERRATLTKMVQREDGKADWSLPAVRLERMVRAYTPWPGLYTIWRGKLLKVLGAAVAEGAAEAGRVVALEDGGCAVGTGRGLLVLKTLLLEGRRPLPAAEFIKGYREFIGSRLGGQG
jgi:methionyl-tRNA formyltransferase